MIEPFVSPDWRAATAIIHYLTNPHEEPGLTPEDVLRARIAELSGVNKHFPIARAMLFSISLGSQISRPEPPEIV